MTIFTPILFKNQRLGWFVFLEDTMAYKSTAKSESWARDLKEALQFRGFEVSQSSDASGMPKLTLNTDEASLAFDVVSAISKDVFGNDLNALTPHTLAFASRDDGMTTLKICQIMQEAAKLGIDLIVKNHATVLATAEAASGTKVQVSVRWPTKAQ